MSDAVIDTSDHPDTAAGIDPRSRLLRPTCLVPLGAATGLLVGVLTALSAWWLADLDADETLIGTALGAIMGAGLGTAAGLVASVLFDPSDLIKLCHRCRRPITGGHEDCRGCGCPEPETAKDEPAARVETRSA